MRNTMLACTLLVGSSIFFALNAQAQYYGGGGYNHQAQEQQFSADRINGKARQLKYRSMQSRAAADQAAAYGDYGRAAELRRQAQQYNYKSRELSDRGHALSDRAHYGY